MECKDLGPQINKEDFSMEIGNTTEITIGPHDRIIVTVDHGDGMTTKTLIAPKSHVKPGEKATDEQDFSYTYRTEKFIKPTSQQPPQ